MTSEPLRSQPVLSTQPLQTSHSSQTSTQPPQPSTMPPGPLTAGPSAHRSPVIGERRLHPAYLLISAGRTIRTLIPLIAVSIWRWPYWVLTVIAATVVTLSLAWWWMRRYSVTGGVLRVRAGLLHRTVETVPRGKITALDAKRGVIQRMLGVWELKVRTPGDGDHAAVTLACLSSARLIELRRALDPATEAAAPLALAPGVLAGVPAGVPAGVRLTPRLAPDVRPEPVTLAVLHTRTLLIAAVTGTSIPLLLVGAAAAWNRLKEVLPDRTMSWVQGEVLHRGSATLLILAILLILAALTAVLVTSLRLAKFTLSRDGDRLRITRGLFAQRSGTITVDRVQAVRLVEGIWRQLLGYTAIEVEVAGLGGRDQSDRMLFPLIRTTEAFGLIRAALPELGWTGETPTPVSAAARRRYFTVPFLVSLALAAAALLLPGWGGYLAVLPIPVGLLIGLGQSRAAAWRADDATVTVRWRRTLARHTVIARIRRVQITKVSATVMQRRAGLAGVRLLLSSRRTARLRYIGRREATALQHTVGRRQAATQ